MKGERRVFVTGSAGCVGHYVVERLLSEPGNQVHVLLRDPGKLRADLRERVSVHQGDLAEPQGFLHLLPDMDAAVLAAASWGGEEARQVNVLTTWAILDALDPSRCRRVVYFSTASLLGPSGQVLDAARDHGTGYIRQKYEALEGISRTRMAERVFTVFPTVVMGGDAQHPYSHASRGLLESLRYLWLLRFMSLDGRFHVIHAHDIARAVGYLLDADLEVLDADLAVLGDRKVALGYRALEAGEAIRQLAAIQGLEAVPQLDLTGLALVLPYIVGHKFTTWDRYCLHHRDMSCPVFDIAGTLGPSGYETLAGIVQALQAGRPGVGEGRNAERDKEASCGPLPC